MFFLLFFFNNKKVHATCMLHILSKFTGRRCTLFFSLYGNHRYGVEETCRILREAKRDIGRSPSETKPQQTTYFASDEENSCAVFAFCVNNTNC